MTELVDLVNKHRAHGLLIDTNLFLLYLVGLTSEHRIAKFNRTQRFTIQDFRILTQFVNQFRTIVTTPHILTEISNLANLRQPELQLLRSRFRAVVEKTNEIQAASRELMADDAFPSLGLTDAAIIAAAKQNMLVLTDDAELFRALRLRDFAAINFNHIQS
jgi:predicted nucleic acid-binding protein